MRVIFLAIFCLSALVLQGANYGHIVIDVRQAGQVTSVPASVMLVNNTMVQPGELGHKVIVGGSVATYPTVDHRAAGKQVLFSALSRIIEEGEYPEIGIIDRSMNTGSSFYKRAPLSRARMDSLCNLYQVGALVILNQVVCQSVTECFQSDEYQYYAYLQMHCASHWTVYEQGVGEQVYVRQDTLLWESEGSGIDNTILQLPAREEALEAVCTEVGVRIVNQLFAHWESVDRYLYMDKDKQIVAGVESFQQGRWQQSIREWLQVYQQAGNKPASVLKAKAAANIAVAYEMMDELGAAAEWAQAALQKWSEKESVESEQEQANLREYIRQIQARQKNSHK